MKRVKEARKSPSSSPVVLGDEQPQTIQALQDELKRLQEQLREAEVKAEAYDGLINVAEAKFNILIRKRLAPSGREPACEGSRTAWGSVPLQAVGVSKQAYYKHDESKVLARAAWEAFALEYIRGIRSKDPGIGGTKLWHMYRRDFQGNNSVGRDWFAYIINRHDLKVRQKVRKPRTADSSHGFPTYPNLIKDFIPSGPDQLWAGGITYIIVRPDESHYTFCYLSLIMDAYTEEIVGWSSAPRSRPHTRWRSLNPNRSLDSPGRFRWGKWCFGHLVRFCPHPVSRYAST